jgi:hypothetical protein
MKISFPNGVVFPHFERLKSLPDRSTLFWRPQTTPRLRHSTLSFSRISLPLLRRLPNYSLPLEAVEEAAVPELLLAEKLEPRKKKKRRRKKRKRHLPWQVICSEVEMLTVEIIKEIILLKKAIITRRNNLSSCLN